MGTRIIRAQTHSHFDKLHISITSWQTACQSIDLISSFKHDCSEILGQKLDHFMFFDRIISSYFR